MICIGSEKIVLRSVDSSDIDTILLWENANNDPLYGIYEERYSREDVVQFIENQQRYTLSETEQLRLMICSHKGERLGAIDLTEYDGESASISIMIFDKESRGKGYGKEALRLIVDYANSLGIKKLNALIHKENEVSRRLFVQAEFCKNDQPSDISNSYEAFSHSCIK